MTKTERKELTKQWKARVAAFKESGQGTTEWCAAHDLKPHQLRYWLRKFESEKADATSSNSKWVSVEVNDKPNETGSNLLIKIGQVTIEVQPGFNPKLLSDIVRTLTTIC